MGFRGFGVGEGGAPAGAGVGILRRAPHDAPAARGAPSAAARLLPTEASRALQALAVDGLAEGEAFEVRVLLTRGGATSGVFRDAGAAVAWLGDLPAWCGAYFTPNPVRLAPGSDRAAGDGDVPRRRWLLLDVDPVRPRHVSATDAEKAEALGVRERILEALRLRGWPDPVRCDSGNGYHAMWRVELPAGSGLPRRVLRRLAEDFDTAGAKVDLAVHNPSRIWKLPGTLACKGEHTAERPHRMAAVEDVPAALRPVPLELLEELAVPDSPATPTAPQRVTAAPLGGRPTGGDAASTFGLAVEAYNRARTREFPARPGTCPACGHNDCFKGVPGSPGRWICFSSNHGGGAPGCGRETDGGRWSGDALDLDAYAAGLTPVEHLRAEGHLGERDRASLPSELDVVDAFLARLPREAPPAPAPPPAAAPASVELPTLGATVGQSFRRFYRRGLGEESPIGLPWPRVTAALNGGLWPGMHVLVGNTGSGKSQFALQIAVHAAERGVPVLYFALELGHADTDARVAALLTGARWSELFYGRDTAPLTDALAERIAALPFVRIVARPYGWSYSVAEPVARAMLERYSGAVRDAGGEVTRPFLVVLDYLQIVSGDNPREELRERIGKAAGACRAIARDLDAAVLVVSSTSRENGGPLAGLPVRSEGKGEERREVYAWDESPSFMVGKGKEAGEIEFCADTVLVLAREALDDVARNAGDPTPIHLAVAKQRAGAPSWVSGLYFNGHRFTEGRPPPDAAEARALSTELASAPSPAFPGGFSGADDCGFT